MHLQKTNFYLNDPRLSLVSKGLLSILYNLPKDIPHYVSNVVSICKDKNETVRNSFCELEKFEYIKTLQVKKNKTTDYVWELI